MHYDTPPQQYQFRITRTTNGFVQKTEIENPYYTVKFMHLNNFDGTDNQHGNLTVTITPKDKNLNLIAARDSVLIEDPELNLIDPDFADELTGRIHDAAESAKALRSIIQEYLGIKPQK